jgi:hypothetical protein
MTGAVAIGPAPKEHLHTKWLQEYPEQYRPAITLNRLVGTRVKKNRFGLVEMRRRQSAG